MKKNNKVKNEILEKMQKIPVIEVVCQQVNISRMTLLRWKKEDPEFSQKVDEAISEGRLLINDLAESGLISHIKDRNLSAIIHWLKTHNKVYKEKVEVSFNKEGVDKALDQMKEVIEKINGKHKPTSEPIS
jgi:hypothetical protein